MDPLDSSAFHSVAVAVVAASLASFFYLIFFFGRGGLLFVSFLFFGVVIFTTRFGLPGSPAFFLFFFAAEASLIAPAMRTGHGARFSFQQRADPMAERKYRSSANTRKKKLAKETKRNRIEPNEIELESRYNSINTVKLGKIK